MHRARLPDGRSNLDIAIKDGQIMAVEPALAASSKREIDAVGHLVAPPFVDAHFHMVSTLTTGWPRLNECGTLAGGHSDLEQVETGDLLSAALNRGIDVVGGIPHFKRTQADGALSVQLLCEIAAERGLMVDIHCDGSDDLQSRFVEHLDWETQRLGQQDRITGSHLTSMHSMDNDCFSKLLPLIAEAGLQVIANPLINVTLQGRHDSYPKRRGMTCVP